MVGGAGFGVRDGLRDLVYTLDRQHWGHGLGTEVAAAVRDWHWEHPDPHYPAELSAHAAQDNGPSRRILDKIGFWFLRARDVDGVSCMFYRCNRPTASHE